MVELKTGCSALIPAAADSFAVEAAAPASLLVTTL
jgi:hypothetical protein